MSRAGLHSAILAKTLPFLLLCACASTAQLPTADQPELAEMAQSYAQQLRAVGITRVRQILAALVPEAVRVTSANNRLGWLRANPWH